MKYTRIHIILVLVNSTYHSRPITRTLTLQCTYNVLLSTHKYILQMIRTFRDHINLRIWSFGCYDNCIRTLINYFTYRNQRPAEMERAHPRAFRTYLRQQRTRAYSLRLWRRSRADPLGASAVFQRAQPDRCSSRAALVVWIRCRGGRRRGGSSRGVVRETGQFSRAGWGRPRGRRLDGRSGARAPSSGALPSARASGWTWRTGTSVPPGNYRSRIATCAVCKVLHLINFIS